MLQKLRRRLALLCAGMTSLLLAAVLVLLLLFAENQLHERYESDFRHTAETLAGELHAGTVLRDSRLVELEVQNRLVLFVRQNGEPLFFPGAWAPAVPRDELRGQIERYLAQNGFPTENDTLVWNLSPGYRAAAVHAVRPLASGGRTLDLWIVEETRAEARAVWTQRGVFAGVWLLGVLVLAVMSRLLAGRLVRPVAESRQKQVEFIAAASHELRSPLAVIEANAADPVGPQAAQVIRSECARMGRLVGDLLLLAGRDANAWSLQPGRIETDAFLIELYDAFEPLAREKGHTLSLRLPELPLPALSGDGERIRQALSILLNNAIAYTPAGGTLLLSGEAAGGGVWLRVADNGPGIPDDKKSRVFERFYRLDPSRTDKSHMGLGLSVAQELVAMHRGKLVLTDTPGGGCTFSVWLRADLNKPVSRPTANAR